jgi:agmatinase
MKIYQIPRINALGLRGPEEAPEIILKDIPSEKINIDNDNIEESEKIIYDKAKEIFSQDEKALFVGGDHSITYPLAKAFQKKNEDSSLIIFDAHIDCDFCAKEPTHEEWLRGIVETGFNPKNIVLIGIRKEWEVEKEFLKENGIKVFNKIEEETINYIKENSKNKKVYLSIDIDALDPEFAPAVNYPEPNGLDENEFKNLLKEILKETNVKAIDIVEIVPGKDIENKTINLTREIISIVNS